ncbi:MAG: OmpA family protein [Bacteroidetes bacterium]|nr:OmpA family protein [Bacteroidota bacterium]
MLRNLLTLSLLLFLLPIFAQQEPVAIQIIPDEYAKIHHQGEMALLNMKYKEALSHFKKVLKRYPDFSPALRSSGACYELLGELGEASHYYVKALENSPNFSRALYFECGKIYYQCGKYELALKYFEQFDSLKTVPPAMFAYNGLEEQKVEESYYAQLENNLRSCRSATDSLQFLNISSVENLGSAINGSGDEYFPYLTNDGNTIYFTSRKNDNSDENLLMSTKPRGDWKSAESVSDFNTGANEGMVTMVRDGRRLYFTACQRPDVMGTCDIWEAVTDGMHITQSSPLAGFSNSEAWESQASISCDGSTLYFASSREGGFGGTDIWFSQRGADGKWGEAVNLGDNINTTGDEEAPFITNDGKVLYFSSTGHLGLGEQDIFVSRKSEDGSWGFARNLGMPVNSAYRELGIFLTADGKTGYFSSNRKGGHGGMDIYKFELPEQLSSDPITYVEGYVRDSLTQIPVACTVFAKGHLPIKTGDDGRFFLCLPANDTLQVEIRADDYHEYKNSFDIPKWENRTSYHLNLLLDPMFRLPTYTGDLLVEKGVSLPAKNPTNEVHQEVLFDFDKAELKPDDIEKLEDFFKNAFHGKTIESVEIVGYTDEVGSDAYNLVLSEKRAKAIGVLLKNKGIKVDKIYIEGKGESNDGRPQWQNRKVDVIVKLAK